MKTLKCDLCEHEEQAQTFEEWMEALKPHYMQAHADVMSDSSKGQDDMMRWVKENKARFDAAAHHHSPKLNHASEGVLSASRNYTDTSAY